MPSKQIKQTNLFARRFKHCAGAIVDMTGTHSTRLFVPKISKKNKSKSKPRSPPSAAPQLVDLDYYPPYGINPLDRPQTPSHWDQPTEEVEEETAEDVPINNHMFRHVESLTVYRDVYPGYCSTRA